jgi:hypothetical protein
MKTIKLLAIALILTFAGSVQGQFSVNIHIGTPPAWGPSGYSGVRYYYLPDIECYYDIQNSTFIYLSGNRWIHNRNLPARYRNYDLNRGYKVVMNNYHGNTPYVNFRDYRTRYAKGYRGGEQHNIGERNNHRSNQQNFKNKNQERYNGQDERRGNDKNQERGNGKEKNNGHNNRD